MVKGKGFNLTVGILDIIVAVLYFVAGILMFLASSVTLNIANSSSILIADTTVASGAVVVDPMTAALGVVLIIIGVMYLLLFALYLTFGILTIKTANAGAEKYYSKTGMMLGFSITLSILLVFELVGVVVQFSVLGLISLIVSIIIVLFHWLGFGFAKSGNGGDKQEIQKNVNYEPKQQNTINDDDIAKLEKIAKLKEMGVITEEEYNDMKSKIIK